MIDGIEWRVEPGLLAYPAGVARMEERAAAIREGTASELIWLVEHPPIYTSGTSAAPAELLDANRFPVFATGRGGRHTYHGPGQRVVYVLLDLERRGRDLRRYVAGLERWILASLAGFGVAAFTAPGRIGVWVSTPAGEAKIAAIGVRVRRWISYHGLAINVAPDLAHFAGIVPCGIADHDVTSLRALGVPATLAELDAALALNLPALLANLRSAEPGHTQHVAMPLEGGRNSV